MQRVIIAFENCIVVFDCTDEPPLEYWKELAESRRQALEESLEENLHLHQRVEELEKEKVLLEEMVEQAKQLASILEVSETEFKNNFWRDKRKLIFNRTFYCGNL